MRDKTKKELQRRDNPRTFPLMVQIPNEHAANAKKAESFLLT